MNPAFLLSTALCGAPAAPPAGPTLAQPQPAPLPRYPIGWLPLPDFLAPGDPLTLTDFSYAGPETSGGEHAWRARVRWLDLGYVTAELVGERHGLSFLGHRLSLSAWSEDGDWTLGAGFRTSRFVFSAEGRSSDGCCGRDWVYGPTLQFRLTPDVELYGWVEGDTSRPHGRSLTEFGAGTLWQRGAGLEANLQYARAYATTAAGDENRVDTAQASLVAQVARAEITAFTLFEDTEGRFPRREGEADLRLRLPLLPRLLLEADGRSRFDVGAGSLGHSYGAGLTWFGRRFTLPRAGRVASSSLALARLATQAGEYEFKVFGDEALREQRERLSLSRRAPEFRSAMAAVYRAQVEERAVPLIGFELRHRDDVFTGERTKQAGLLLGMPWPPAWPWSSREDAVPFLKLELEHAWVTTASHFRSESDRVSLTISLSREMDVVARYVRAEPTALDVVLGIGTRRRFAVEFVYARGS
jgi:hypothetical protein